MDVSLGGLAFFFLIAAQFFAVIAVHKAPWETDSRDSQKVDGDVHVRHRWNFGS
jgi:hypothetical protein